MSILQDFEIIKKELGEKEWALIEDYLKEHKELLLDNVIYSEEGWNAFQEWKKVNNSKDKKMEEEVRTYTDKNGTVVNIAVIKLKIYEDMVINSEK